MTILLGAMTGTSADGLDLCLSGFTESNPNSFQYKIINSISIPYERSLSLKLRNAHLLSSVDLLSLDIEFAHWCAEKISHFTQDHVEIKAVAFHGSTVFHQPDKKISFQLGRPETLAALLELPIIADFRSPDLELGGRGAPLVPFGDGFLFGSYSACLNLGGFANYSESIQGVRIASDISFCNYVMDKYARLEGLEYDANGELASQGCLIPDLFSALNERMATYNQQALALSREWVESSILSLFPEEESKNILYTCCEHIGYQVAKRVVNPSNLLITGGGAYNSHLLSRIEHYTGHRIKPASPQLIEMKEALLFAFLGWLRLQNRVNCFASVTGAKRDHSTGIIYYH